MLRALLFGLLAGLSFSQSSINVRNCDSGSAFQITDLSFTPTVPVPGSSGTLVTSYNVPAEITGAGGKTRYKCALNGLPVYDESFDLCSQTACPIKAGAHVDKSVSQIPNTSGKVVCDITWAGADGTQLLCIEMTMKLVSALRGATAKIDDMWSLYG